MSNQTEVSVRRTTSYPDRLRRYKVKLDGVVAASVAAGESITLPIVAGTHAIELRIDWCGSERLGFDVQPGEHIAFECGSNLIGWRILLAPLYIALRTHQYLWLRRAA